MGKGLSLDECCVHIPCSCPIILTGDLGIPQFAHLRNLGVGGWESPYPLSNNPITNEGMKKGIAPNPLESFDLKNRGSFGGQQLKSYLSISMAVLFGQCYMTGLTFLLEF